MAFLVTQGYGPGPDFTVQQISHGPIVGLLVEARAASLATIVHVKDQEVAATIRSPLAVSPGTGHVVAKIGPGTLIVTPEE